VTPERAELIRTSWARARERPDALAHQFYEELFRLAPHTRSLFAGTGMNAQGRKFIDMLSMVVDALDDPETLEQQLTELGRKHANYGVKLRDYPVVGDALLLTLAKELGSAMTPETRAAWAEAYDIVSSIMVRALDPW
jgi:hemoglobin-like flavoprotein